MSLLGIDVGTSGCKSAVFAVDGPLISLAYEEFDYRSPQPGWAELDTAHIWQQIRRVIGKSAAAAALQHDPIRALCVSSLGEAVVPVSRERQILGPSLLNFDLRGDEFLPELSRTLSNEALYRCNGNTLGSPYSLTKLMWIKRYQPDLYRQADLFLHWSGFISYMLGAEPYADYTLANRTLLFDLGRQDWSDELLSWSRLDREKLPPTVASGQMIGRVAGPVAAELGLPVGIPIISGGHDQCCNSVGCGVIRPGRAMYGMGTYICMVPVFSTRPAPAAMIAGGLNTEHHAISGQYVSFIYNQGGALVKWFRDTFARSEYLQAVAAGQDIYPSLFAEMPAGPGKVVLLPHFTTTGPPRFIQDSCGVMAGLKLGTSRGEILKGIVEAATFYIKESFDALPTAGIAIDEFCAVGGGSKSDAWVQISADILDRPFTRPKISEAGALGAAILAGVGSGVFDSLEGAVTTMVQPGQTFRPNPAYRQLYADRYAKYQRLEPLLAEYLRDLAA